MNYDLAHSDISPVQAIFQARGIFLPYSLFSRTGNHIHNHGLDEFEDWMEQQRDQIQKLADNKDKSFYYKDDNGSYVCREWTQEDVDSLYESWKDQLALMKEGYHFTKAIELSNGGVISGAFDPETWNAEPASAPGSTIITLPDGSTVDLGHFDTADAATKAVQEYLEQQVSAGNMTQADAENLLNNGSVE